MTRPFSINILNNFGWLGLFLPIIFIALYNLPLVKDELLKDSYTPAATVQIETIGHQWWWEFRHKDADLTLSNELHLPADQIITMTLSSADAIHSFWLPEFGGKIDVLPGLKTQMVFRTPKVGKGETPMILEGKCMEHRGAAHALMRFKVYIHEEDDYGDWLLAKGLTSPSSKAL